MNRQYLIYLNQWSKDTPNYLTPKELIAILLTGIALGKDYNSIIKKIRKESNKDARRKLKKGLPCFVITVNVKGRLCTENITHYNKEVLLDFDFDDHPQFGDAVALEELKQLLKKDPYVKFAFISTSGNGIKVVVPVATELEHHLLAYQQLCNYFKDKYTLIADTSGSDPVRNCCISIDVNPIVNYEAEVFPVNTEVDDVIKENNTSDDLANKSSDTEEPYELKVVRELLTVIEGDKIDVTKNRKYWLGICFFLARYGNDTLDLFLRICQFYPKYDSKECKELFAYALKEKKDKFTLGTLLKACKETGMDISKYTSEYYSSKEGREEKEQEFITPTFPDDIFAKLPAQLRNKLEKPYGNSRKRDSAFLSALVCYSAILPNVLISYGGSRYTTHLYFILGCPSGSNKSVILEPVKDLAKVNDEILLQSEQARADYFQRKEAGDEMNGENPPTLVRLIYGADISLSGILKKMNASDTGVLLIATELDSFNKNKGEFWGNADVLFRAAFQNEPYSMVRNDYEIHLKNPRMAHIFTGTPDQVRAFMPECENGLSNRYIIYVHNDDDPWDVYVFEDNCDMEGEIFDQTPEKNLRLFNHLHASQESTFVWSTSEHLSALTENYRAWHLDSRKVFGSETGAIIKRLGIIVTRIACILTVLRKFEGFESGKQLGTLLPKKFTCSDTDFQIALSVVNVLRQHSLHLYENLHAKKKTKINASNSLLMQFFDFLPEEFARMDIMDVAISAFGVHQKTIDNYLRRLCEKDLLQGDVKGFYIKVNRTTK